MTISNQTNRTSVVGTNTVGQEIPFSFPISDTSDLVVKTRVTTTGIEATLTETTNYTVVIDGDDGGTVTMVTAVATTSQIHVIRDTPNTQEADFVTGDDFNAENVETALDKNTKLIIENTNSLSRTPKFADTDPNSSIGNIPSAIDRASKGAGYDSAGKPNAITAIPAGSVSFSTIGTNIAEAANAAAERVLLGLTEEIVTAEDADNYADFATAISTIGATETELHIHTTQAVTGDVTVPATLTLVFHKGGNLNISSAKTVTVNSNIIAGWYIIFVGDGVVAYNGLGPVKYNWFGTGAAALTDAINFLGTGSRTILLPGGDIDFSTTAVVIDQVVNIIGQGRPVFDGAEGTRIIYTGAGIAIQIENPATSVVLRDFQLQGSGSGANGIKIGKGGVGEGVTQPQLKNIGIDDFTAAGLEIDFVVSGLFESISIKACDVGLKVVKSFRCVYNDINIVDSIGIGLHLESGSAGEIAYNKFENFNFTGCGEESVNIGGTGAIRNCVFDTFQMETSQALAGQTDGNFHWLVGSDGYASKQIRNTIKNVVFSGFSRSDDNWDGTTGNRCIKLQKGRWYIENLNSELVGFGGVDVFVATADTLLNLGNITERELSRWDIPVTVETVCTVAPLKIIPVVSVATDNGSYETVVTYTVPKNTTGGQTVYSQPDLYADANDDLTGGTAGIHILVQGNRTTGAAAAARVTFGGNTVAEIANDANSNVFIMEVWIWNRDADGLRYIMAKTYDGASSTKGAAASAFSMEVLTATTVDPAVAADIDIDVKASSGGQCTIQSVLIERF